MQNALIKRKYTYLDTGLGKIVYFQFGDCTQWKNITNGDLLWTVKPTKEFELIHSGVPIETFASKRLSGFSSDKITISGSITYNLAEKKVPDGYLYEIPATLLRLHPKKSHPEMLFPYTRYNINAIRSINHSSLVRLKTEETVRYNNEWNHSISDVSMICDHVYDYCKSKSFNGEVADEADKAEDVSGIQMSMDLTLFPS